MAGVLILSSLVQLGCGDDGDAETSITTNPTMTPGTTTVTTASTTDPAPTEAGTTGTSDTPTGGSVTDSNSDATTGPGTDATGPGTSTVDPTTGEPITATDTDNTGTSVSTTSTTMPDETTGTTTDGDTTSGTSGDTSSSGADETTMDVPCDVMAATLKPVIPNMMLVLDKSGSMLTTWDHDANVNTPAITRWNSLFQVVDGLTTKFNDKLNLGANLFPNKQAQQVYDASACPVSGNVEVTVKPKNKLAIMAAIPAANTMSIAGGTPAAAGVTAALNHLKTLPADVPRAILLVTDGAANCKTGALPPPLFESYDQTLHTVVSNAFTNDGIPTYVVGINTINAVTPVAMDGNPDGINPFTKLNELAVQGGNPKNDPNEKFYNADNQIELGAALDAIVADALSCVIPLDNEPAKPELTEVEIDGVLVKKVDNCANENGWVYTKPNGPYDAIELCGTACTNLKMIGKADVNFFCVPN